MKFKELEREKRITEALNNAEKYLKAGLGVNKLEGLKISDYNKRYLKEKLMNPESAFGLYKRLLKECLIEHKGKLNEFAIVDYGGGSGLFSIMARCCGIGYVLYNDIYDVSCNDVKTICKHLNIELDAYICGDLKDVNNYLKKTDKGIDALCSFDVIEHVYDIKEHLNECGNIRASANGLKLVLGSGANGKNPWINKKLREIHNKLENDNREKMYGHKERDSLKSYLEIRKSIIKSIGSELNEEQINELAKRTRGLIKNDIEKIAEKFIKSKTYEIEERLDTNTCDPMTGNWAEHIMKPEELNKILEENGFRTRVKEGYWVGASKNIIKSLAKRTLNLLTRTGIAGKLRCAPYYILIGQK